MDKRCEHFLFRKLSGLPTPATILTYVIQTQPALKSGSRRSPTMRRSIGYSGLVHPVHQSDQSFSGNRSGCLCKHATANLRAKLKSSKLSSWEDCSPSRSTANNQKCSESSSQSLSPCPLSYSNPCITSVYASHLFTCDINDPGTQPCLSRVTWRSLYFGMLVLIGGQLDTHPHSIFAAFKREINVSTRRLKAANIECGFKYHCICMW